MPRAQFGLKMKWGVGVLFGPVRSVSEILNSVLWSAKTYNHFHSIIIFLERINFQLELYYMYTELNFFALCSNMCLLHVFYRWL